MCIRDRVDVCVEKISSNKSNITNGDKTSLVSMDNSFRLDLAATNAAVKNMSLGQAYLSTAISTLDSASAILSKIHQLAVLGANGSNSDADNAAINMEAEALADAFHKSMTAAQFKGKAIFSENPSDSIMAAGGRSKEVQIGVEKIDYDFFYDYENPALTTPDAGIKYEIRRALTNEELTSLLLRDPTLSASALIPGFQFTLPEGSNNIGEGSIINDVVVGQMKRGTLLRVDAVNIGRDSQLKAGSISSGSERTKADLRYMMDKKGSNLRVLGSILAADKMHIDHHVEIYHDAPETFSRLDWHSACGGTVSYTHLTLPTNREV